MTVDALRIKHVVVSLLAQNFSQQTSLLIFVSLTVHAKQRLTILCFSKPNPMQQFYFKIQINKLTVSTSKSCLNPLSYHCNM